jgi:steroid delta-isomerase-like uncharacterized protein
MSSLEQNKTLARRFLRDIWSEGKMEVADEILAPDFVMNLGVKPYHLDGPEGLKQLATRNRAAFQGLNYDIIDLVAEVDRVVAYWQMTAKHVGKWGDSEPSNKDVAIKGLSYFRARDGKLIECEVQNEALSLLRQVGTVPPQGAPEYKLVEANKALVTRYIEELLMKGNFALAPELVTSDFKIDRSALPQAIAGPEALHRQMDMLKAAFPDLELKIADMFAEGDKVAVRFEAPGTHLHDFVGIPPTGRKVTWRGIVIYRVENGKVQHAWADWDDEGLIQALRA